MSGLAALIFGAGVLVCLALAYAMGMSGVIVGGLVLAAGWLAPAIVGWADHAVLAVEGVTGALVMGLAVRWTLRHRAWQQRIVQDQAEAQEKQSQTFGAVSHLKEKITLKAAEVERSLKQYELIRRLAEAVSWEEMAPSLERALKHFFRADGWVVYLTDDKGDLQMIQRRGITPEFRAEDLPKKEPYLQTFAIRSGEEQGKQALALALPLWRLHDRIGLIQLRLPEVLADQQATLLADAASFSTQLIFAMSKAKLYRELDQRSRTDGLTGLSRRGPFEERLQEEIARAQSFKSTFSILMIDIDHFKRFNDTYGHQVGDEVLRTVSQRLKEGLYETDVIARYGGEEFVCLLPRSQPAGLRIKADQIRQRVGGQPFVIGVEAITVTISIGIAHFPHDGSTGPAVLAAADRALYAAKAAGRNCVIEAASVTS